MVFAGGPVKILVVDDHPMIREALGTVLRQLDPGIQVLQAGNCEEAFAVAMREPDLTLVLMDLMLPGMNGLVGLRTLREKHPGVPVVVLSASENPDVARHVRPDAAPDRSARLGRSGQTEQSDMPRAESL
jgi:DNA-binding NarL/FixJ family response regulator